MTNNRLVELEAMAASLAAEIAALKAGRAAPPPQPPRDEVRVVELHNERLDGMPNLAELKKLYAVVKNLVPEVKSHDPDAGFRGFAGAYRFVSNCPRLPAPNSRVALSWWLEGMTAWMRARNAMTRDITGSSFIAAVMANGDVLYTPHNGTLGHVWEFGLVLPGQSGGKPASDAWRRVLDGSVLAPSQPARRMAPPSPVRVVVGW
jgi:hypothetical protein